MLATGRPIEPPRPSVTRRLVDHTVVSVGPYRSHTSPATPSRRAASGPGSASPVLITRGTPCARAGSRPSRTDGVAWTVCSAPLRISSCARSTPAAEASTTVPPVTSGPKISTIAMSNDTDVRNRNRAPGVSPGRSRTSPSRLTSPRCGTTTPLARPVEPEV